MLRIPQRARLAFLAVALFVLTSLSGCMSLPSLEARVESHTLVAPAESPLKAAVTQLGASHDPLSGFHALRNGMEAFAARKTLIDAATSSLDVQYYIWHDDMTGRLLFGALCRAADRGVRVRLLLDDNNTKHMDGTLAALAAHRNIEVRLFNPFTQRSMRMFGYMTDFSRLNHRMHNKSLTADGVATIVGGRNVGDEYFDASAGLGFFDLDVLAIGPIVHDVAKSFDAYWNSESAYQTEMLLKTATAKDMARLDGFDAAVSGAPEAQRYVTALNETVIVRELLAGELSFDWALAHIVVDEPSKALGKATRDELLVGRLEGALGRRVENELQLVSPYFVPEKRGVKMFSDLSARGVKVQILTNALEATDVPAVHSGYAHRRKALLAANIELYELRRRAAKPTSNTKSGGSSGASLHAKTFAIDRRQIFIGSFNFDPRSVALNTELGIVIDSPNLAVELATLFETRLPLEAYQVRLDAHGALEWVEQNDNGPLVHTSEPGVGFFKHLWVGFLSILPIEGLL